MQWFVELCANIYGDTVHKKKTILTSLKVNIWLWPPLFLPEHSRGASVVFRNSSAGFFLKNFYGSWLPFVLSSVDMIPHCLNNVDVQALRMPIHFFCPGVLLMHWQGFWNHCHVEKQNYETVVSQTLLRCITVLNSGSKPDGMCSQLHHF